MKAEAKASTMCCRCGLVSMRARVKAWLTRVTGSKDASCGRGGSATLTIIRITSGTSTGTRRRLLDSRAAATRSRMLAKKVGVWFRSARTNASLNREADTADNEPDSDLPPALGRRQRHRPGDEADQDRYAQPQPSAGRQTHRLAVAGDDLQSIGGEVGQVRQRLTGCKPKRRRGHHQAGEEDRELPQAALPRQQRDQAHGDDHRPCTSLSQSLHGPEQSAADRDQREGERGRIRGQGGDAPRGRQHRRHVRTRGQHHDHEPCECCAEEADLVAERENESRA